MLKLTQNLSCNFTTQLKKISMLWFHSPLFTAVSWFLYLIRLLCILKLSDLMPVTVPWHTNTKNNLPTRTRASRAQNGKSVFLRTCLHSELDTDITMLLVVETCNQEFTTTKGFPPTPYLPHTAQLAPTGYLYLLTSGHRINNSKHRLPIPGWQVVEVQIVWYKYNSLKAKRTLHEISLMSFIDYNVYGCVWDMRASEWANELALKRQTR